MSYQSERTPDERRPEFEPLSTTFERVIDNVGKRTGKPDFPTGLDVIDKGIWGLHPAQLTILAARPGIGKTALACQCAVNLAKNGKKVAFLSLEMTKETILERMFCQEHEVNGYNLLCGSVSDETMKKMSMFIKTTSEIPLRIIDDYCHTENQLYTLIEHLKFHPEVIILDHIQHIRCNDRKNIYESLTEYFRFLKEVAMRYKIAVMCLSQINREGEEAPSLANLKGCGALEEMADHVIMMHQIEDKNPMAPNFKMVVAKNRFGPIGTFNLDFRKDILRFYNL